MAASVQVQTEIEKPGFVMVCAIAHGERMNDGRPVAGFFVRRRYEGDRFMLADPSEFSPVWMRFEDPIPKEWEAPLKKRLKVDSLEQFKYQPPPDPARQNGFAQVSMSHMLSPQSNQMDGHGNITPRVTR